MSDMLAQTGKAAVIHPTGTGKSFIAYKLCEEHLDEAVCWLSPSEYIFHTQVESLRQTGGQLPGNIRFYTYAKLMNMSRQELEQLNPRYIILDEFHRCGAEMWGQGVEALLKCYPGAKLLGLSATHIRYLDNQRDMAAELFDGNIASEMTLGEAIVRGILNPPKYVLSVFAYQKELERYQYRVAHAKNKAVRELAGEYLEALRRALEQADGLDVVFRKHMDDRAGKYIVFCSSVEHLHAMIALVPKWFSQVDKHPHVYSAYSDHPETDEDFQRFKEDNSSHLKLLYCVDMLNEGIHVENISGVILLRPTVSPIIYKQQIGRALSAQKNKHTVIFDIVLNIENLYSIGAVEKEMQTAVDRLQEQGLTGQIINSKFKIVDEVRDCIDLFNGLSETLSASWDMMYDSAKEYFETFGDLEVPVRYMTKESFSLGLWIKTQRQVYEGKCPGILTKEQIDKLNQIGMRWDSAKDLVWEKNYAVAKEYYQEHGGLPITVRDRCYHGIKLERWLAKLRSCRKSGSLTEERIAALDSIGMVWDIPNYLWEQNYRAAVQYHEIYGNIQVPRDYVTQEGIRLGLWIASTRRTLMEGGKDIQLSQEQIQQLKDLGLSLQKKKTLGWDEAYEKAKAYRKDHGDLKVPASFVTQDGYSLGKWIRNQRSAKTLSQERREKLNALGMVWELPDPWEEKFALAERCFREQGRADFPSDFVVEGVWLGKWLQVQKRKLSSGKLTSHQVEKLAAIGIVPQIAQIDQIESGHNTR